MGRRFTKNQYIELLKKWAWTIGRFKGAFGERKGVFLSEVLIPHCAQVLIMIERLVSLFHE